MKVDDPSPDRAPVGQETLVRSHQTSGTDKTHHMSSLLKGREIRLCIPKTLLRHIHFSNEINEYQGGSQQ